MSVPPLPVKNLRPRETQVADYDYLFVRPDAKLDGSKPISGGLPHCFPQFGPGEIQQHGFGRNLEWEVAGTTDSSVSLKLANNDETMAMWPHPFECVYKVRRGWVGQKEVLKVEGEEAKFLCMKKIRSIDGIREFETGRQAGRCDHV